ncbi:MAG TPA: BACON domain-containing carbohydrate-binding protein [Chthoniobacterales bacterium]|nr:BACON domain-containing carbohydrate-binding protein [Chthoniobacterales bacterium]
MNLALAVLLACAAALTQTSAQQLGANQLDPNFGQGGRVATQFDPTSPIGQYNIARTALIQPDGKILAVGVGSFNDGMGSGPALIRYFANGQLDYSFGNQGRVRIFPSPYGHDGVAAVLQPDGRIIMAGTIVNANTNTSAWMIARVLPNGQVDTSFGAQGRVVIDISQGSDSPLAVKLQSDGKIVIAGSVGDPGHSFALVRLNASGSFDTTFAPYPWVITPFFGPDGAVTQAHFLPDGRVAVAGPVRSSTTGDDIGLAVYNADGSLDATFAKSTTDFVAGAQDVAGKLASTSDGRIVISGGVTYPATTPTGASDMVLARFNPDGTLDTTFDGDGKVVTDIIGGMDSARAVVIQADGKIVVVGDSANSSGSDGKMTLVRYNDTGSKDSSFGADGIVRTDFSDVTVPTSYGLSSAGFGAVIQPDGQIIATGTTVVEARRRHDFALARYRLDSTGAEPPPTCAATVYPTGAFVAQGGGTGSFQVSMPAGCGWQAQTSSDWISLTQSTTGGNGIVNYSVAANSSTSSRTGTITVGGATFTVTQQGAPSCTFNVSPTSASYSKTGGKGKLTVTASSTTCGWTAQSNSAWITITSGSSGRGNGTVQYTVAKNQNGVTRTGTLTVGGVTVTIQQAGR